MPESSLPRRGALRRKIWDYRTLYILLLPGVIAFLLFAYGPLYGLIIVFKRYNPVIGFFASPWVGLENFQTIFRAPGFLRALRNTVVISSLKILVGTPLPILFALLINELYSRPFKRVVQTISYLPYFISWVVVSGIWYKLLSSEGGVVNDLLLFLGLIREPVRFMQEKELFYPILILTDLWKNIGFSSILYLAAIVSIDPELFEAAVIDGAGRVRQILHITLPCISSTIAILFILTISGFLDAGFDQLYTMGNLVVRDIGDILDTLVLRYLMANSLDSLSLGAAMGFFKSVVGFFLFLAANKVAQWLNQETVL